MITLYPQSGVGCDIRKALLGGTVPQQSDPVSTVLSRGQAAAVLRGAGNGLADKLARLLDDPSSKAERWHIFAAPEGVAYIEWHDGRPASFLMLCEGESALDEEWWEDVEG